MSIRNKFIGIIFFIRANPEQYQEDGKQKRRDVFPFVSGLIPPNIVLFFDESQTLALNGAYGQIS
ncbi:MAG: hypothetical protein KDC85_03040 [Saprospiraceae bacterium]|nr:hypothetical protein [Saprospiraceae bacterium]